MQNKMFKISYIFSTSKKKSICT